MSPSSHHGAASHSNEEPLTPSVHRLEWFDNAAHIVVGVFLILMAASVLVYCSMLFVKQVSQFGRPAQLLESSVPRASVEISSGGENHEVDAAVSGESGASSPSFMSTSLELLSSLLFAVILLELLRTFITYLKTQDIQAIMREFMVVGIISSVRKILLVGAQAAGGGSGEFKDEAIGTVISIIGILLLIVGLIVLERHFTSQSKSPETAGVEPKPTHESSAIS